MLVCLFEVVFRFAYWLHGDYDLHRSLFLVFGWSIPFLCSKRVAYYRGRLWKRLADTAVWCYANRNCRAFNFKCYSLHKLWLWFEINGYPRIYIAKDFVNFYIILSITTTTRLLSGLIKYRNGPNIVSVYKRWLTDVRLRQARVLHYTGMNVAVAASDANQSNTLIAVCMSEQSGNWLKRCRVT